MTTYKSERTVISYAYFVHAAWSLLEQAKAEQPGSYFDMMAAMVFCAFALEGYLNHVGPRCFKDWAKIERKMGVRRRLAGVCVKAGLRPDFEERPFKTFCALFHFRGSLAHASTTHLVETVTVDAIGQEPPMPETPWEKIVTPATAAMFYEDTRQMIETIHKHLGFPDDPFFTAWFSKYRTLTAEDMQA